MNELVASGNSANSVMTKMLNTIRTEMPPQVYNDLQPKIAPVQSMVSFTISHLALVACRCLCVRARRALIPSKVPLQYMQIAAINHIVEFCCPLGGLIP